MAIKEIPVNHGDDYKGIADFGLRQFLLGFEEKIRAINNWPTPLFKLRHRDALDLNPAVCTYIIKNRILNLQQDSDCKHYYVDKNQAQVLAAIHFVYENETRGTNYRRMITAVQTAREYLGTHPLANLMNEPPDKPGKSYPSKYSVGQNNDGDDVEYESDLDRVEATAKNAPKKLTDRIPSFDEVELDLLKSCKINFIEGALRRFGNVNLNFFEEFSALKLPIHPAVIRALLFIEAVRQLENKPQIFRNFDPSVPSASYIEVQNALITCKNLLSSNSNHTKNFKFENVYQIYKRAAQIITKLELELSDTSAARSNSPNS